MKNNTLDIRLVQEEADEILNILTRARNNIINIPLIEESSKIKHSVIQDLFMCEDSLRDIFKNFMQYIKKMPTDSEKNGHELPLQETIVEDYPNTLEYKYNYEQIPLQQEENRQTHISYTFNNKETDNKLAKENKLKANKITDLILKINSLPHAVEITNEIFGENLMELLLTNQADDLLIEKVDETLKEIQRLHEEERKPLGRVNSDDRSNTKEEKLQQMNITCPNRSNYNLNKYTQDLIQSHPKTASQILGKLHKVDQCDRMNFESSLRSSSGIKRTNKIFNNFSKQRGDFFDAPLMKGGVSKFEQVGTNLRSKSKPSLLNPYTRMKPNSVLYNFSSVDK